MKKLSVSMTRLEFCFGWFYLALQLLVLPSLLTMVNGLLPKPLPTALVNFLFFTLNFICTAAIFHRFLAKSLGKALQAPAHVLKAALLGVVLNYAGSFVVSFLILLHNPEFTNVNTQAISEMAQEYRLLMSLGTILLVPVAEESLFRGLVFRPLYNRKPWMGYLASSLLFASIHVVGYIGRFDALTLLLCFVQYFPPSLCLGWAYAKTDTICAPILMHVIINAIGIFAMR